MPLEKTPQNMPAPLGLISSVRLLAAIAGLSLASTGEPEMVFLICFLSFFLFGMRIQNLPVLAFWVSRLQPVFAALVFLLAIVDFLYLSNSFLLTVAHFLLLLQGLNLLSLKTTRNNLGSILLSSLMVLSASTLAVEWTFFVALFLFLPGVVRALIIHHLVFEGHRVKLQEDKLWKGGQEQTRDSVSIFDRSSHWTEIKPMLRESTAISFVVAIVCCAIIFTIFPRFNFRGFRGQFLQPVHKSGFTNQVELGEAERVFEDNSIVMRVEIDPDDRDLWTGYLRGQTLDLFDGRKWRKSKTEPEKVYRTSLSNIPLPVKNLIPGKVLEQSIYLESMNSPLLFAVSQPVELTLERPFVFLEPDGSISRGVGDSWRVHYNVKSQIRDRSQDPQYYKRVALGREERKNLIFKDPDVDWSRIRSMADELSNAQATPFERAKFLEGYLRNNYQYSLQFNVEGDEQPIERFLFRAKKGHCEYFSSALVALLRSQGVPARMVTGFLTKEWNNRGNYFVTRMSHAHAWVEAYFDDRGWERFDPSPIVITETPAVTWLTRFQEVMDYLNLRWNQYILSYDMQKQVEIVSSFNQRSRQVSGKFETWLGSFEKHFDWYKKQAEFLRGEQGRQKQLTSWIQVFTIGLVFFGGLSLVVYLLRFRVEKGRIWFYKPLVSRLGKLATPKRPSQTLGEYFAEIRPKIEAHLDDVTFLINTYNEYRFGHFFVIPLKTNLAVKSALNRLKN